MHTEKLTFKTSNRILRTYKNFPYKPWYAIAELVDNSTQSYRANKEALDALFARTKQRFEIRISYDAKNKMLSVWDNAMGMSRSELQHAVLLAEPPEDTSGRSEFGMGMKTSCSWLGRLWSIETKKLGENERFKVSVDIESFTGAVGEEELDVVVREQQESEHHFTLVEINHLFHEFKGNRLKKIKEYLVSMYREDIRSGDLVLKWDGFVLEPEAIKPLVIVEDGAARTWKVPIDFTIEDLKVKGFACILAKENRGRKYAGFDLLRRGRVVLGRPGGYRPEIIFGEARNDMKNQRLYGELHMDDFPVNHLKDDFLWESFQEEFDDKLNIACKDILAYLKTFRAKDEVGVSSEAREAADDAVADELSSDQMVQLIEFLRRANPPEPVPEEAALAEAVVLRELADTYRETRSGRIRVRIYHLKKSPQERKYMTFVSSEMNAIDVFINDNHPFVHRDIAGDPQKYETYVKACVYDALAEWIAREIPKLDPETISYYKDQLMRGPGLEAVNA
ncbi:MAG TPA: ATP-binding protein [Longimicrobium sp.]|nr:ATP-binding protein [Longimicrobium sp.]